MESIILMSLPGRMFSSPLKAELNSAAALVIFGGCSGALHVFGRRREHVSGWSGGGIRRLRSLHTNFPIYYLSIRVILLLERPLTNQQNKGIT